MNSIYTMPHKQKYNWGIIMRIILGVIAIVVNFINLYMYKSGKDYKFAMSIGLSFTALTICSENSLASD